MYGGKLNYNTPMLFGIAFILLFTFGGFTGVIQANAAIDLAVHDTYYVIGHFHYVQSMGAVYALFGGFYYWIGKISGYQYPELWGKIHFWVFTQAINIVFFPMHFQGLAGIYELILYFNSNEKIFTFLKTNGAITSSSINLNTFYSHINIYWSKIIS